MNLARPLRKAIRHDRVAQVALHGNQDRGAGNDRDSHLATNRMRHVHELDETHVMDRLAESSSCAVPGRLGVGTGRGAVEAVVQRTTKGSGGDRRTGGARWARCVSCG